MQAHLKRNQIFALVGWLLLSYAAAAIGAVASIQANLFSGRCGRFYMG